MENPWGSSWAPGAWADGAWSTEAQDFVTVPDVVGDDEATATATLEAAGFLVNVASEYTAAPEGEVASQFPIGGGQAALGSMVTITVSLGAATGNVLPIAEYRRRARR